MLCRPRWDLEGSGASCSLPDSYLLPSTLTPVLCSCKSSPVSLREGDGCLYWLVDSWARGGLSLFLLLCTSFILPPNLHRQPICLQTSFRRKHFKAENQGWLRHTSEVLFFLPSSASIWVSSEKQFLFLLLPQSQMLTKPAWLLLTPFN